MIVLKSPREIALMREAGRVVAVVLETMGKVVVPGITTAELDRMAERIIRRAGGEPAFLGYHNFPASICTSINEEVVHGIPSLRRLQEGDIISIDVGVRLKGYCGDGAATFAVGKVTDEADRLIRATQESLQKAIAVMRPGGRLTDISYAVQEYVENRQFAVVRDYVGHGIGMAIHEEPQVPNFGPPGRGPVLEPGIVLAIEPMVNVGTWEVKVEPDQWTVKTGDGALSAHFEHTVAMLKNGPAVLTAL